MSARRNNFGTVPGGKMKLIKVLSLVALGIVLLGAPVAARADVVYNLTLTAVAAFGAGPYGTVTLHDNGTGIDLTVALRADMNFVNTGGPHSVFSFNATGVSTGDISNIKFDGVAPLLNTFTVVSPGANQPFGTTFSIAVDCTGAACQNGAPGQSADPLTFTVANAEYSDFGFFAAGTTAYFAADVICIAGACNGSTGAVGAGGPTTVPEPGTLALFSLGLLGIGLAVRIRRAKLS